MTFEMKQWLTSVGIPADKLDAVLETLGPYADRVKGEVMAQSDYSRNMDQLRLKEQEISRTQGELNAWRDKYINTEHPTLMNTIKQLETEKAILETSLRHDYGVDPSTLTGRTPWNQPPPQGQPQYQQPPANPNQPPPYPGTQLTQPPANTGMDTKAIESALMGTIVYGGLVNDLQREHERLFGQPFKQAEFSEEYSRATASNPNLKPQDFWEQKYNVQSKRQELATIDLNAKIEAARKEGYDKARSEVLPPGAAPRQAEHLSPFMKNLFGQPSTPQGELVPGQQQPPPPANPSFPNLDGSLAADAQANGEYWNSVISAHQSFHEDPEKTRSVISQYGF